MTSRDARRAGPRRAVALRAVSRDERLRCSPARPPARPLPDAEDARRLRLTGAAGAEKPLVLHLAQLAWIEERANVCFFGPPGTGKTHLTIALGLRACQHGLRVAFATAQEWVSRPDFALVSRRYERGSIIMVAWWTSRSIRAAATSASPRISPHCSKARATGCASEVSRLCPPPRLRRSATPPERRRSDHPRRRLTIPALDSVPLTRPRFRRRVLGYSGSETSGRYRDGRPGLVCDDRPREHPCSWEAAYAGSLVRMALSRSRLSPGLEL
jgi:hypothetical protein